MRRRTATTTASVLLAVGLAAGACGDDDVSVDDVTEEPGIPPEIEGFDIDGADQYLGERVTVESDVTVEIDDRTFYIEDDGGNGLLVYASDPVGDEVDVGDTVRVTGTVAEVDLDDEDFGTRHALEDSEVELLGDGS